MPESNNHFTPTWTSYICTLGPASSNAVVMEALVREGANFLRNNFAHAQYDEYLFRKTELDRINAELGTNVWMQADLQGRNIRVQKFENEANGIVLEAGKTYCFATVAGSPEPGDYVINDDTLHIDLKAGEPIIFADGLMDGVVDRVVGHRITVTMRTSGFLKSRKSINVPETKLTGSSITDKDKRDLEFLMETGVDWVALSFISTAAEIHEVRQIIGDRPIKIMAKIERRAALDNMQEIIVASDAVMIARGDLGIEIPLEDVPVYQAILTEACKHAGVPVITATQMLLSMAKGSRPTRAEVTDVAHAVFERSDAVMLSEETAEGINPAHTLATMVKIAKRAEEYIGRQNAFFSK